MTEPAGIAEFSRPVAADAIGPQRQVREISADAEERRQLARRFGLLSLDRLEATVELRRHAGDVIRLTGRLAADVVQSCVVSLAPVPAHIEADFETSYSAAAAESPEVDLDPLGEDAPEPLVGGGIDLGEAVAQQLAVALDPYPRAPGVVWNPPDEAGEESGEARSGEARGRRPFAGLAALQGRPPKKGTDGQ
jgi:uncharacterized metal-binding protein YceD (DUF177 family)